MFVIDAEDKYAEFIMEKMHKIDPKVYDKNDFELYLNSKHENILYIKNGNIIAFCVILLEHPVKMAYSWSDKTVSGKKAYAKGIDYVIARHNALGFGAGALKLNKIRRLANG